MSRPFLARALCACALAFFGVTSPAHAASFANGSDVSWVDQEESSGYSFYNSSGVKDSPVMRNLLPNSLVINHKCRHHLPLIVSNIEHAVSGNLRAFGEIVVANDEHA